MTIAAVPNHPLPNAAIRPLLQMGELLGPRMTGRQMSVLVCLATAKGPMQLRDVAAQLMVPKPSAFRSIAALVRAGLVNRAVPESDRRDAPVVITPLGREMIHELSGCIGALSASGGMSGR